MVCFHDFEVTVCPPYINKLSGRSSHPCNIQALITHFNVPRVVMFFLHVYLKMKQSSLFLITTSYIFSRGTRLRSWLRHCVTSRKVAGSIPDGVNGIFH